MPADFQAKLSNAAGRTFYTKHKVIIFPIALFQDTFLYCQGHVPLLELNFLTAIEEALLVFDEISPLVLLTLSSSRLLSIIF